MKIILLGIFLFLTKCIIQLYISFFILSYYISHLIIDMSIINNTDQEVKIIYDCILVI